MARGEDTAHHPGRKVDRFTLSGRRIPSGYPVPGGPNEMMSMPTPGVALSYDSKPINPNVAAVLTDHGAYTPEGYQAHFGNPDTGKLYPDPNKFDFDYDKEITAEDRAKAADRARQDTFW